MVHICNETKHVKLTLPEINSSPLKMDGWNTILSYWGGLFSGALAVSFREGNPATFLEFHGIFFLKLSLVALAFSQALTMALQVTTLGLLKLSTWRLLKGPKRDQQERIKSKYDKTTFLVYLVNSKLSGKLET